jgi:putative sterol carrier protein
MTGIYDEVAAMDREEFEAMMADPAARDRVIDALVEHFAGAFRPDAAGDLDAVIHIKLWDRPGGGYDHREIVIRDGACTPSAAPSEEPRLTLKVRPTDLRDIVTGAAGPKRLAFKGRLRVLGDLGLAMRLTSLFAL